MGDIFELKKSYRNKFKGGRRWERVARVVIRLRCLFLKP